MSALSEAAYEAERRYQRLDPPRIETLKRFRERGVSVDALCEPELIARAEVEFFPDRHIFDFSAAVGEEAVSAFILLARDEVGDPCDLVAWAPQTKRVATWYGNAALLGAENVYAPRLDLERALPVHQTPLEWLLRDRSGVVVIDPRGAAPLLRLAEPLAAETIEHGKRLRQMLTVRPPRIFVANRDMRSAA